MTIKTLKHYNIFKNEEILTLRPLKNQGFCNINYLLRTSKDSYVLREFKELNINRENEYKIHLKAFKKGIATKPIFLDKDKKFMVYKFLKASHKYKLNKKELKNLIKTVKKLHSIKVNTKKTNLEKELKKYIHLKDKKAKKSLKILKRDFKNLRRYEKSIVTCHHDLNPKNILFRKNSIKLIDWEYAGSNDSFFDLATICQEFNLDKKERLYLLKNYLKIYTKKDISKLELYISIYRHLCKLWFINLSKEKA